MAHAPTSTLIIEPFSKFILQCRLLGKKGTTYFCGLKQQDLKYVFTLGAVHILDKPLDHGIFLVVFRVGFDISLFASHF